MPEIKLLDQATINQIAAGEVIDRPSSVVKELLENAMDAKASAVTVEIKDGGISFIRVTDNGCGIEKSQIPMAFCRHATSKLHTIDDLLDIGSLGFRGEALSSIAAVAQVELITKPAQSMLGVSYRIEDGQEQGMTEIGAPDGTTILVRNLFYHVPARKKFLKTAATEGNYIGQLMENMAMLRPDISIRFINGGQTKLYTAGNGRLKDLIYTIYGREISSNLLEVSYEGPLFKVRGYLGKPIISRGNRSFENYYINGRYVKSRLIAMAIEQAYKPFMMQHRYPFTAFHLEILPELIDVNVHPSKMEIRFQKEQEIYEQLTGALESALRGKEFIPDITEEKKEKREEAGKLPEPFEKKRLEILEKAFGAGKSEASAGFTPGSGIHKRIGQKPQEQTAALKPSLPGVDGVNSLADASSEYIARKDPLTERKQDCERDTDNGTKPESKTDLEDKSVLEGKTDLDRSVKPEHEPKLKNEQLTIAPLLSKEARKRHRLIGQLFDTYWLIQYENSLYIMDQHAAHEKVNYERLMESYRKKERMTQLVSPPVIISLTHAEESILVEYRAVFEKMGFSIEPYGGREYAITEVPANIYGIREKDLFLEMLAELTAKGSADASELVASKLASMSCKAAVKGGQKLSFAEAEALVDQLMTLENPYACPHGRPTIITMTKNELEKKFKRII